MTIGKKALAEKLNNNFGSIKEDYYDFEKIRKYFENAGHDGAFQILSDRTCDDLNFEELFQYADRTTSRIGQQYLYKILRVISPDPALTRRREDLITVFNDNEALRTKVRILLSKLNNPNAYYITSLFQEEQIKPPSWFFMIRILAATSLVSLILSPIVPQLLFLFLAVFIINLIIHYWNKIYLYQYVGSVPQLLRLNYVVKGLMKFKDIHQDDRSVTESVSVVDKTRNRMSFFKLEAKLDSDMASIVWSVFELVKIAFLLEPLILYGILKHLESIRDHIHNLFRYIGEIDLVLSIASLRKGLPYYCMPDIVEAGKIIGTRDIYHPLVPDCVPNSLHLEDKSILITGSNMSGKTTFIRTIGVNTITALSINTCFARKFQVPLIRLYSAIRMSDDLMNDKSYYFEEVLIIKEMINHSLKGTANLFLLDEIYKGTNTVERIAAGKAVLSLLNRAGNFVFVSTHDIELADLLKKEYDLYNFSEKVDDKTIGFDFKLKPGKLKTKNAISILELNDYPAELIEEARELAEKMEKINAMNKLSDP